jgi:hypothetical protein
MAVDGPGPKLLVDVCYRLDSAADAFALTVSGAPRTEIKVTPSEPAGGLRHATAVSAVPATIDILPTSGRPELCGVIIETDPAVKPGVVLDTLGINGARYATALAGRIRVGRRACATDPDSSPRVRDQRSERRREPDPPA